MAAIDTLPPLREVIERYGLMAKKSLGQNFLLDLNLTSRVARASGPLEGASVIEIGPGPGGLTRALLAGGVADLIVIERDDRCIPALEEIAANYPGKMRIIAGDALEIDHDRLQTRNTPRIVANLPYNIGTQLLINWLRAPWPPWYASLTLMFQKEVAQRIVAAPGSDAYGRLGILAGWRCDAKIMFDIAPSAFVPPPKITSSVVHLVPKVAPIPCDLTWLERITQAAFGQRRKMLRQSLKTLPHYSEQLLQGCNIRPDARPETLSIADFCALARAFAAIE